MPFFFFTLSKKTHVCMSERESPGSRRLTRVSAKRRSDKKNIITTWYSCYSHQWFKQLLQNFNFMMIIVLIMFLIIYFLVATSIFPYRLPKALAWSYSLHSDGWPWLIIMNASVWKIIGFSFWRSPNSTIILWNTPDISHLTPCAGKMEVGSKREVETVSTSFHIGIWKTRKSRFFYSIAFDWYLSNRIFEN